jgi:hypothetical protein
MKDDTTPDQKSNALLNQKDTSVNTPAIEVSSEVAA